MILILVMGILYFHAGNTAEEGDQFREDLRLIMARNGQVLMHDERGNCE